MSRVCFFFALAAAVAGAAERPTLPSEFTLSQALEIALANSTAIRTAMSQLEQASGQYLQTRSPLLPQLGVRARQDYMTTNLVGLGILVPSAQGKLGPFASMDARVFLTQELLNLSDIRGWQSSRSREQASRLLVDNARELVAL